MIAYFARHPVASNLILLAVALLGFSVLQSMERENFPEFSASRVSVSVNYPGASAADVDDQICLALDDALGVVNDLDELECLSLDGRASATLTMAENGDIGQFYNDISSEASSLNSLPATAEPPAVSILGQTETIALLAVSGIDTIDSLISYADQLANDISNLTKVATATVSDISNSEFRISFDQTALRRFGVSARDVSDAVSARSLRTPLGTVATQGRDITLRYFDARRSIADLEDLVILQNSSGGFVRLGDLARVIRQEVNPEKMAFIDGQRAAIIRISKTKTDDAIDAFGQVQVLIDAEMAKYPDPFHITVINNTTKNIEDRITLILRNSVQSLLLVILVMCLFFTISEAIWISLALPFSFLGGIFAMNLFGVTINMISLIALLMSIGLIMDDSIVIADNIAKWRGKLGNREAAIKGAGEVMPGVVSSFLTTACVFGPLMFLSGEMGSILQVIPIVLLITLMASLIEAFWLLPNHMSHVNAEPGAQTRRLVPRNLERLKNGFVIPLVQRLTRWRYATLGTVIAIFIFSISLIVSGAVKVIGFPSSEGDTIEARFALSSGLPIERSKAVVDQLLAALAVVDADHSAGTENTQPLVERVLVTYASNSDVKDNGAHSATITVDLLTSDERHVSADDVLADWRRLAGPIPDLVQSNFTQSTSGPGGSDLDVQLSSRNLADLERATAELLARLLARPDVTEAYRDFTGGRPEIRLSLNEYAYTINLTPKGVSDQLKVAFSGTETDSFRQGLSDVSIWATQCRQSRNWKIFRSRRPRENRCPLAVWQTSI
jgi:HAE1 family hydrophobic/amphiphilic exporter-1